jgi:hypothetical protein
MVRTTSYRSKSRPDSPPRGGIFALALSSAPSKMRHQNLSAETGRQADSQLGYGRRILRREVAREPSPGSELAPWERVLAD